MKKTARFVIWICSKFTREEIEEIVKGLLDVLANRNPEVKPKDDFKEKQPHYRDFFVDPNPPLKAPLKPTPKLDWRKLLSAYEKKNDHLPPALFLAFSFAKDLIYYGTFGSIVNFVST